MIPALTAVIYCIGSDNFTWWLGILAVIGVGIAHLGMNLADDYFDYKQGIPNQQIRSTLAAQGSVRARMDKCSYILSGEATIEQLYRVMWAYLGTAGVIGAVIFVASSIQMDRVAFVQAMAQSSAVAADSVWQERCPLSSISALIPCYLA